MISSAGQDPEWEVIGGQQMSDEAIVKLATLLLDAMGPEDSAPSPRPIPPKCIAGDSRRSDR